MEFATTIDPMGMFIFFLFVPIVLVAVFLSVRFNQAASSCQEEIDIKDKAARRAMWREKIDQQNAKNEVK